MGTFYHQALYAKQSVLSAAYMLSPPFVQQTQRTRNPEHTAHLGHPVLCTSQCPAFTRAHARANASLWARRWRRMHVLSLSEGKNFLKECHFSRLILDQAAGVVILSVTHWASDSSVFSWESFCSTLVFRTVWEGLCHSVKTVVASEINFT